MKRPAPVIATGYVVGWASYSRRIFALPARAAHCLAGYQSVGSTFRPCLDLVATAGDPAAAGASPLATWLVPAQLPCTCVPWPELPDAAPHRPLPSTWRARPFTAAARLVILFPVADALASIL